jgi:hypothetical protein
MALHEISLQLTSVTHVLAQNAPSSQSTGPSTFQVIAWLGTGAVGLVAILGARRLSEKTRLEARKLQLEILEKEKDLAKLDQEGKASSVPVPTRQETAGSPQATAAGTQDFIIRFIILALVYDMWAVIQGIIAPAAGAGFAAGFVPLGNLPPWAEFLGYNIGGFIGTAGSALIFIILGLPLLSDIAASLGVTPRDLLRRRR